MRSHPPDAPVSSPISVPAPVLGPPVSGPLGVHPVRAGALLVAVGLASCLGWADRVAFSAATDAIENALGLGDAALGAIGGLGFAALYAVAGIPLARIADGGRRLGVLVGSIACLSLASTLTGRCTGFASLFATRVGAGLGEAGLTPSALPLLGAVFPRRLHALAMAGFWGCGYSGLVLGLWGGGVLIGSVGWRGMFEVFGMAGLPVAGLVWWLARGMAGPVAAPAPGTLGRDVRAVLAAPGMVPLLLYGATGGIVAWGGLAFDTPFYMRHFHMDAAQAGFWFGNVFGVATALGALLSGPVASFVSARTGGGPGGGSGGVRFAMLAYLVGQPFQILAYASDRLDVSLFATAVTTITGALTVGPVWAALLGCVPAASRGLATVAYGFASSLVGAALGPMLFGALSDALRPEWGEGSLRIALIVCACLGFWPLVHLEQLARRMAREPVAFSP